MPDDVKNGNSSADVSDPNTDPELHQQIEEALDKIRPYLMADGGSVRLLNITEDYVVELELLGACGSCPMSTMTLRAGIEQALKRSVPKVKRVEAVNASGLFSFVSAIPVDSTARTIMDTRTLGPTNLEISEIGFGAMHLSLAGRPSEAEAIDVLHRVLDLGITFIDTADSYCRDESDKHHGERLVRKALDAYADDTSGVIVATKGGLMRPDGRWTRNGDPDHIRATIRESVNALGDAPIQLWQHHAPDPEIPVETSLRPVREAVDEGLIQHVGVSNYSVEQIERVRDVVDVVSVQNQYSPWHRQPETDGVLAYCEAHDLVFLPWSPLGGRSRAKDLNAFDDLNALADEKGISPQRLVLAWLMAMSSAVLPIPGASRVETAADSIAAADVVLTDAEVQRVERAVNAL